MKFTAEDFKSRLHATPLDWDTAYQKMADVANERLELFTDMPHRGCMCQDCVSLRCSNASVSRLELAVERAVGALKSARKIVIAYTKCWSDEQDNARKWLEEYGADE